MAKTDKTFFRDESAPKAEGRVLSVDPTAKKDHLTRWVLTDEFGWSELVHEATNIKQTSVAEVTHRLAEAYYVDTVMVRSYGIGYLVADCLTASHPEDTRKYQVWCSYPGARNWWVDDEKADHGND